MKKYIITLLGKFENNNVIRELISMLLPIVDSPHLKFQKVGNSIIVHFATDIGSEEIYAYLEGGVTELYSGFLITELNSDFQLYLPKKIKDQFLNLDEVNEENEQVWFVNTFEEFDEMEDDMEIDMVDSDEEFIKFFFDRVKSRVKRPTLDQLLDKISSKGIQTLSKDEIEILNLYSKN